MGGRAVGFMTVDDAQRLAKRKLPRSVYDFVVGGTDGRLTVEANRKAFELVEFVPRAAVVTPPADIGVTVLGCDLSMPVVIAPTGFVRMVHPGAEVAAATAAGRAGTAIGISTMASSPIEAVVAATPGPVFYQLYFAGGRQGAEVAIDRAKAAGCRALIVTVDLPTGALRERGPGVGPMPRQVDLRTAVQYAPEMVLRPGWVVGFLRGGRSIETPNVRLTRDGPPLSVAEASSSMTTSAPGWDDFTWIRQQWPGRLLVKGILSADDARRARDVGADAVSVSNHGGFALDSVSPALKALPRVVDAVGQDVEVLMDGGVRRGADVVKAMALGARAVLVGRAYLWPLAVAGQDGVEYVLRSFHQGIQRTLQLLGCPSLADLDRSYVDIPAGWG